MSKFVDGHNSDWWDNSDLRYTFTVHLRQLKHLNNMRTQNRAVIFAPHMCISVLFDLGKFEMCASFHSEDIGKSFFF